MSTPYEQLEEFFKDIRVSVEPSFARLAGRIKERDEAPTPLHEQIKRAAEVIYANEFSPPLETHTFQARNYQQVEALIALGWTPPNDLE